MSAKISSWVLGLPDGWVTEIAKSGCAFDANEDGPVGEWSAWEQPTKTTVAIEKPTSRRMNDPSHLVRRETDATEILIERVI
jgi:hypothetical protein